ncbi:radial spoke protein [Carpediemonas membranifera]|uniref:Radial spoke protein n=1 Tax=Carpediemonas membranifera TaxID=201153 RepID=A0A8J6AUL7_9EUKA|nr:radial spoke protein [Carpediemonas membranifera]|eukprot:KAG9392885.1 radial spoke protein [Carpediemonas membranifera]
MQDSAIPPELTKITKEFCREVLREQPTNIYSFGAKYFATLVKSRRIDVLERMSMEEFKEHLISALASHVSDNKVDQGVFKKVLWEEKLGLSSFQVARAAIVMEEDERGLFDCEETISAVTTAIFAGTTDPDMPAPHVIIHGSTPEEFVEILQAVASTYPGNMDSVPRAEAALLLRSPDLGLTAPERRLIMGTTDAELRFGEDAMKYTTLLGSAAEAGIVPRPKPVLSTLTETLIAIMQELDDGRTGRLPLWTVRDALFSAGLGLTRLQVYCVLADAVLVEADMTIEYMPLIKEFAAAHIMHLGVVERHNALVAHPMPDTVLGADQAGVEEQVADALRDVSDRVLPNGNYAPVDVYEGVRGDAMRLSRQEAMAILAAADSRDGVAPADLQTCAFTVLCAYTREKHVQFAITEDK